MFLSIFYLLSYNLGFTSFSFFRVIVKKKKKLEEPRTDFMRVRFGAGLSPVAGTDLRAPALP